MEPETGEKLLLDTSIFVDHLSGHQPATAFFNSIADRTDIYFSAITEAELVQGSECSDSQTRETVLHFLHRWNKVTVSNQIAVKAGDIARKHQIAAPDAIIAATAQQIDAIICTQNTTDFQQLDTTPQQPY